MLRGVLPAEAEVPGTGRLLHYSGIDIQRYMYLFVYTSQYMYIYKYSTASNEWMNTRLISIFILYLDVYIYTQAKCTLCFSTY